MDSDNHLNLLSSNRVSRAKKMMQPFVLRRKKADVSISLQSRRIITSDLPTPIRQVLTDLPLKIERIEWCGMGPIQEAIYRDTIFRSKKAIAARTAAGVDDIEDIDEEEDIEDKKPGPKKKKTSKGTEFTSSHILMDLRKAAIHQMLFRRAFTNEIVMEVAKAALKEPG